MTTEKTSFWNEKNIAGKSSVGKEGLLGEDPRSSDTQSKFQVSSETLAAADLQSDVEYAEEISADKLQAAKEALKGG